MENIYLEEIQRFIASNYLKKQGELLLFDALIRLHSNNVNQTFSSQVHIISMQHATAVYVYEFFKTAYNTPEMYSTEDFSFICNKKLLEIRMANSSPDFLLTIQPIATISNL